MLAPQALSLPHFLEDQFVWLSIGSWCVLLTWLRTRVSRRRLLMWAGLAGALHLTPVTAQVIRATSAIGVTADGMPFAFWALQALNVAVLPAPRRRPSAVAGGGRRATAHRQRSA
jgi:hypothetical protein